MHQDVYNEIFEGEGAPDWAVCTNGVAEHRPARPLVPRVRHQGRRHRLQPLLAQQRPGRSAGPVRPGLGRRGAGLQEQPLGPRLRPLQRAVLDVAHPLRRRALRRRARVLLHGHGAHRRAARTARRPLRCPEDDPAQGVVPTIEANDPTHLIFDEPDNYASRGLPDLHRADGLPQPRLQRAHLLRRPQPGDGQPHRRRWRAPTRRSTRWRCGSRTARRWRRPPSRTGPAWMVTEFGATSDPQLLAADHRRARRSARSAGSTGPGSTTAIPRGAPTSPSSWRTGVCVRPPTS